MSMRIFIYTLKAENFMKGTIKSLYLQRYTEICVIHESLFQKFRFLIACEAETRC